MASKVAIFLLAFIATCAITKAQLLDPLCRSSCICSDDDIPVCANDLKTYKNECQLRCGRCVIPGLSKMFEGRCEDSTARLLAHPRLIRPDILSPLEIGLDDTWAIRPWSILRTGHPISSFWPTL